MLSRVAVLNFDDHIAGYKRPPKATQFKPGQSGNRAGRPKGSHNKPNPFRELIFKDSSFCDIHVEDLEQMQRLLKMLDHEIKKTSSLLARAQKSLQCAQKIINVIPMRK